MTFRFPIARLILIGLLGAFLTAAGEFPAATIMAVHAVAPPKVELTEPTAAEPEATIMPVLETSASSRPALLSQLVTQVIAAEPTAYGDRECLARAVFFEARGEPLEGQLAVAQVILNRVASGRFAGTVCGVINQRGQFSFDRARVPGDGRDWRVAKAIAAIAATAGWQIVAPQATAFHATRITASWTTMRRVSTIGNHVFYR